MPPCVFVHYPSTCTQRECISCMCMKYVQHTCSSLHKYKNIFGLLTSTARVLSYRQSTCTQRSVHVTYSTVIYIHTVYVHVHVYVHYSCLRKYIHVQYMLEYLQTTVTHCTQHTSLYSIDKHVHTVYMLSIQCTCCTLDYVYLKATINCCY